MKKEKSRFSESIDKLQFFQTVEKYYRFKSLEKSHRVIVNYHQISFFENKTFGSDDIISNIKEYIDLLVLSMQSEILDNTYPMEKLYEWEVEKNKNFILLQEISGIKVFANIDTSVYIKEFYSTIIESYKEFRESLKKIANFGNDCLDKDGLIGYLCKENYDKNFSENVYSSIEEFLNNKTIETKLKEIIVKLNKEKNNLRLTPFPNEEFFTEEWLSKSKQKRKSELDKFTLQELKESFQTMNVLINSWNNNSLMGFWNLIENPTKNKMESLNTIFQCLNKSVNNGLDFAYPSVEMSSKNRFLFSQKIENEDLKDLKSFLQILSTSEELHKVLYKNDVEEDYFKGLEFYISNSDEGFLKKYKDDYNDFRNSPVYSKIVMDNSALSKIFYDDFENSFAIIDRYFTLKNNMDTSTRKPKENRKKV